MTMTDADQLRAQIAEAQDALGEFWVTSPTLPDACRALYKAHADNCRLIREHLVRADIVCSDDPVEAVGQLVDEMNKRGRKLREMNERLANAARLLFATDAEIDAEIERLKSA